MGYQRSDNHGSGDRWRERERGYGRPNHDRDYGRGEYGRGDEDDRGFFDRAGDEVRSWFGDDEAQRRREIDERRWERERAMEGHRDRGWGSGDFAGTGGGWGNQRGESWGAERPGTRSGYEEDRFGGQRFDRHQGRGAHAPSGGLYGAGSGSATSPYGSGSYPGGGRGRDLHDPHYSQWRSRQIEELDRDYDEYRHEHQSKFEQEFGDWRGRRQSQRQSLRQVTEHMEVVGSDGEKIGTVDKIRGDRIILTRNDETAGGHHHSIPCSWIESVEDRVIVNKTAQQAKDAWRDEENSRALFEREDQGSDGPHVLNRSFSGTY